MGYYFFFFFSPINLLWFNIICYSVVKKILCEIINILLIRGFVISLFYIFFQYILIYLLLSEKIWFFSRFKLQPLILQPLFIHTTCIPTFFIYLSILFLSIYLSIQYTLILIRQSSLTCRACSLFQVKNGYFSQI